MGAFTISSIAVILCCWPLAVLSFLRHQGKKSTIMWGVFCAFIGFWGIASFFASTTMDKAASTMWWRFATIGSIMSPPTFYHFTHLYFEEKRNWILVVVYTMAAFFLYSNFFLPGLFLGDVWLIHNEFYFPNWTATKGILFVIFYFSFFVVLLSYSLWLMIKGFRKAKGQARNKIKYFFVGMFFGWIGGHGDFIPVVVNNFYPYPNFLIAIYPLIIGHAIIRHKLFDFNFVIQKGIVYSISIATLSLLYLVVVILFEGIIQDAFHYESKLASICIAFLLGLIFIPIRNRVQMFVDRKVFKGTPQEIAKQNELLRQEAANAERYKIMAGLTGDIVKEIKDPLTAVNTYSHFLPQRLDDEEFLKKFATKIRIEVDRINSLLEHLIDYSNPQPLSANSTNIFKLLNDTIVMLKSNLLSNNIAIERHFSKDEEVFVSIDQKQFNQALVNLVNNAVEAMPDGGTLTIEGKVTEDFFHVILTDTGVGIEKKDIPCIFNPFFTTKEGHTGLGLSVAQGIIENHKGAINVISEVGHGTMVKIKLPKRVDSETVNQS